MIDELDLAFEDDPRRGRHRHRRGAQKKGRKSRKRRRRGRTFLAFLLALLLLAGLGGVAWYGFDRIQAYFVTPDYASSGTGEAIVEVRKDESLTDIGNTLYREGVVKSAKAFIEASEANPRSRNIEPGIYRLRKQMRASEALAMLLDVRNKITSKVTIPEGRSAIQIYKLLSEKTGIKVEEFAAAGKDPASLGVANFWFTRRDGKKVARSVEGFLFPATYEFSPGLTAEQILKQMVDQFIAVAAEIRFVERVEKERGGIAPYEALIVASLAQAEAGVPEDIAKVARVAYNRVYKTDMPLEFDVTVNYYWELTGKPTKASKDMTDAELGDPKNPYSTHAHKGLPPTPINNPGKLALEGAMSPPAGEWLFFVAIDDKGHSAFASSLAEHERNVQTACRNGVLRC